MVAHIMGRMRISKIGLRLERVNVKHSLHEYNEYFFGNGWTLIKGANGAGKTTIVNAISSVFECPDSAWDSMESDAYEKSGEIILDFCQDNSKVTITKKWEGKDVPTSHIIHANDGFEESGKIVKPFIVDSRYARYGIGSVFSEHEIACFDSLTQENPLVFEEINSVLAKLTGPRIHIQFPLRDGLFISGDGIIMQGLAMGEELMVRLAVLCTIHKHTGAPLIFDDWWRGLGMDHIARMVKYLAMVKEECPDGQFIIMQTDYSDSLDESRYGIENYIENVVELPTISSFHDE